MPAPTSVAVRRSAAQPVETGTDGHSPADFASSVVVPLSMPRICSRPPARSRTTCSRTAIHHSGRLSPPAGAPVGHHVCNDRFNELLTALCANLASTTRHQPVLPTWRAPETRGLELS